MANYNKRYIPALRFPEFQNDGEWELRSLAEILNYEQPGAYIVNDTNYKKKGTPVLTANKGFILGYTDESYGVYNDLPVIIFDDFTTDKKFVNFPFKVKLSAIKLLTLKNKNRDDLKFIFECMKNIKFEEKEHKRYYISTYQNIKILVPKSIQEQKKIADCFVSIDKEIDATKRKLEQLKEHKKGLMQKLFPAKGKTLPEFRFHEFKNDGEWVIKQLGAVGDTYGGLSGKSAEDFGVGKPFVTYKQVFSSLEIDVTECQLVQIADNERQNNLQYGDVLVTMSSETPEEVGYTAVVTNKNIPECYLNSFCFIYRLLEDESIDANFLIYLFNSDVYRTNVVRIAQGITRFNISKTKFKEIELAIPEKKDEQRKIAETLSSVDKQIIEYDKKIKALELHKQGLMQQLFPKL